MAHPLGKCFVFSVFLGALLDYVIIGDVLSCDSFILEDFIGMDICFIKSPLALRENIKSDLRQNPLFLSFYT